MSERDIGKCDLKWAGIIKECRRGLSCVYKEMVQAIGWQLGRPCRLHAPKPSEQRQKAMRTGRGRRHLFTSSDEDSEEDVAERRRARPSDPWPALVHVSMERDLV